MHDPTDRDKFLLVYQIRKLIMQTFSGLSNQNTNNVHSKHLDALFQDYTCPGIDSCTYPAVLDISSVERYIRLDN